MAQRQPHHSPLQANRAHVFHGRMIGPGSVEQREIWWVVNGRFKIAIGKNHWHEPSSLVLSFLSTGCSTLKLWFYFCWALSWTSVSWPQFLFWQITGCLAQGFGSSCPFCAWQTRKRSYRPRARGPPGQGQVTGLSTRCPTAARLWCFNFQLSAQGLGPAKHLHQWVHPSRLNGLSNWCILKNRRFEVSQAQRRWS